MNLFDFILNPRKMQRLDEFFCSICDQKFDFIKKESPILNGFIDADTKELVHLMCKENHYRRKAESEFKGMVKEIPLTMDDLEELAIEKKFAKK